ncbi:MAG TPA: 3-isopropylmalate dehydrogenase [Candidatus Sumerlaeota bacterium]|nr:3-isopropylmalate dehydrogenase [Candidatus Sumerlaeota bacterium]
MSKTYRIAVMPGDGTGPEVTAEAVKVLKVAADKFGFKVDLTDYDFGGERYKRTGETLPDSAIEELRGYDSILLGAIGHPDVKPGILEKGILLKARFALDQYINLRPVRLYPGVETPLKDAKPEDINFVVVRENTEDAYAGMGGVVHYGTSNEVATQTAVYTRAGVERAIRYAFECAKKRNAKKPWRGLSQKDLDAGYIGQLTLVGKTNVLTFLFDLWERAFHEIGAAEYPEIKRDYNHVDACCMWFVKNPQWYDVIVTGNLFGDIITDLGAMIQGGMGVAAGGNINPQGVSMFEPIGGSAPKYTGMNIINPLAAIGSAHLMLDAALGETKAAEAIEAAIMDVTANKLKSMAAGKMGYSTTEVGDLVAQRVADYKG